MSKAKEFIDKILEKSKAGEFIFRGTPEVYSNKEKGINSWLYREYTKAIFKKHFSPIRIEELIVEKARKHFPKNASNIEVLTDLRHFGSKRTTLIDFSYNLYIALFFACNGNFNKDGELILLDRNRRDSPREIEYSNNNGEEVIIEPAPSQSSRSRVQFQSSVFVHAPKGYIEKGFTPIEVPKVLKKTILDILKKYHNIYTDTVYNDLLGFIDDEKNFKEAEIEFYKGLAKAASGDHEGAIRDYTEAIELKPNFPEAYANRGNSKAALRKYKEAIRDYAEAIKLKPNLAEAYTNRAKARAALGDYIGAIQDYNKAIELNPNLPEAYTIRGNARAALKDYKGAIQYYTEAIESKPNFPEAYMNRGSFKAALKDYEGAIQDYTEAIKLRPNFHDAYMNRGNAKADLGDYKGAIQDYTEAIELKPDYALAYMNRGNAKADLRKYKEAIQDYTKAIELNPNLPEAYTIRGHAKAALGDHKGARQDHDKAAELMKKREQE